MHSDTSGPDQGPQVSRADWRGGADAPKRPDLRRVEDQGQRYKRPVRTHRGADGPASGNDAGAGFILVAVLAIVALTAGMFVATSWMLRGSVRTASVSASSLASDALLQAGLDLAGFKLFVERQPMETVSGTRIILGDGAIELTVTSDAGRVDLNASDPPLIEAAYRAAGLGSMAPEVFADRVLDWRDEDEDQRERGAEASRYLAEGAVYRPRNGPFHSVDDLRWVLGVSASDVAALRPYVTVANPSGRLDGFLVDRALLTVFPGVTSAKLDRFFASRNRTDGSALRSLADLLSERADLVTFDRPLAYRVTLAVTPERGSRTMASEVIMIASRQPRRAYDVVAWQN